MNFSENYTTRILKEEDWSLYRNAKLSSFANTPAYFMRGYSQELTRSDDAWKAELSEPGSHVLGAFCNNELIGISTILTHKKFPKTAISTGSYVEEAHRKGGVFKYMAYTLIEWCKNNGFDSIIGSHREGNVPMENMMLALDFVCTGKKMVTWADGSEGNEVMYSKELKLS